MKSTADHLNACRRLLRTTQQRVAELEREVALLKGKCPTCASGKLTGWACPDCHRPL